MAKVVDAGADVADETSPARENWNRSVWRIAGPLIVANLSVPLLGIVDTAVVGQLPEARLIGAVAIAAQIFSIVYWGFSYIRQGTSGLTAQSRGAGNHDEMRACFLRGLLIAGIAGAGLIVLQAPLLRLSLAVLGPSDRVAVLVREYFMIRIWSAPAALVGYSVLGWFIGIQKTRYALAVHLFMNGLNIVLDVVFVLGLDLGVAGVAYATLIAEICGALLGIILVCRLADTIGGRWCWRRARDWQAMRCLLGINRDIMIRTLGLQVVFVAMTAIGARTGDEVLAANAVLLLFQTFMAYGLDGFADAVETLSGQAYGARRVTWFRAAVGASVRWAVGLSVSACVVYGFFGGAIIDMITIAEDVRALSRTYLAWAVLLPFISVWAFLLDGIYFGLAQVAKTRNAMLLSLVIFGISLPATISAFGNHGLWLSFTIFMIARGATLGLGYPKLIALVEAGPAHLQDRQTD